MNSQGRKPKELIKLQEELRSLENELENSRRNRTQSLRQLWVEERIKLIKQIIDRSKENLDPRYIPDEYAARNSPCRNKY